VVADGSQRWSAMLRASRRVRAGTSIDVGQQLAIVVEGGADDDGLFTIGVTSQSDATVDALLDALGHMPLPPYIERGDEPSDRERYQTRFARVAGAVAAPTAGLHFSDALIADLRASGRDIVALTLHVGPGTFRPVKVDDLDDHPMHAEYFSVSEACAAAVRDARASGVPVIAVGTTVVRALEAAAEAGSVTAMSGETRLMIQPGHRFRSVDKLITNFHLPGSTLLALVYAFGGIERMRHAYRLAIDERYRFYSYGDAMLIDPPEDEA
jgi:S-adenosylmethionine:tRNA ribosyltransferase-isomerase